jgi:hypothetical protein
VGPDLLMTAAILRAAFSRSYWTFRRHAAFMAVVDQ